MSLGDDSAAPARRRAPGQSGRFVGAVLLAMAMTAALDVTPAAALPEGDATRGKMIYERCQACHSLQRNRSGPKHCGLLGRKAGSLDGYSYSRALKDSGIVWSRETLDRFLENPFEAVPGTRMGYAGVKEPQARADLIAVLAAAAPCRE